MVERREQARFSLEARQAIGIARPLGGQQLERDVAPEPGVARPIHPAHPAGAEKALHVVVTDALAEDLLVLATPGLPGAAHV